MREGESAALESFEPQVALVGAGPGHPGLITLRAVELLGRADLVLYDQLVSPRLLDHCPRAEKVCVDRLGEHHPERAPHIIQAVIDGARQGRRVVRLKGGDPLVFGRGGEEAEALRAAGISFEIVPGVTAALGAAAFAGIPLTHRQHSSAVALVTGHEDPTKPGSALDWHALAHFPGTLVFYMGVKRLDRIARALIDNGKAPSTPAALVRHATRGDQQVLTATLETITATAHSAGIQAPALVMVGDVVGLRATVDWFGAQPLLGRHILVTRPEHQAATFVRQLEQLGAVVWSLPTVGIAPPADWGPVDDVLSRLHQFHWVVFTSVNGVEGFLGRLEQTGRDLRALGTLRLAAIGPSTADALARYHLRADLVPPEYRSESLAAALREKAAGQRLLLARADRGREVLREELQAVAEVEQVAVYSQFDRVDEHSAALAQLLGGEIDYVTLTSPNGARSLNRALDEATRARLSRGEIAVVTISPVTSAAVAELGWPVTAEAREYTVPGVLQALLDHVLRG